VNNGKVFFVISNNSGKIRISVKDTGIGMSADETAALFKDFVRIKNEKTKNITGSGLGLSIMKKIVEMYGGTIHVLSEPEKGTEFIVDFP
jgi:signal transduction histidine kinase